MDQNCTKNTHVHQNVDGMKYPPYHYYQTDHETDGNNIIYFGLDLIQLVFWISLPLHLPQIFAYTLVNTFSLNLCKELTVSLLTGFSAGRNMSWCMVNESVPSDSNMSQNILADSSSKSRLDKSIQFMIQLHHKCFSLCSVLFDFYKIVKNIPIFKQRIL